MASNPKKVGLIRMKSVFSMKILAGSGQLADAADASRLPGYLSGSVSMLKTLIDAPQLFAAWLLISKRRNFSSLLRLDERPCYVLDQ